MTRRLSSVAHALWFAPLCIALAFIPPAIAADDEVEPPSTFPRTTDAHRRQSLNNLKAIGIALHNYHDAMGTFPAQSINDKNGKPLLSWRVAILPYVEQENLYKEFKLDEPWDSKNNKPLIARIPKLFAPPASGRVKKANATYYQGFVGPNAFFDKKLGRRMAAITDGTSNTAMVVEAGEAVVWSKPDDMEYDAKKPVPKLGGLFKEGFHVLSADGAVRMIGPKGNDAKLRAMITPNGGEIFSFDDLPVAKK